MNKHDLEITKYMLEITKYMFLHIKLQNESYEPHLKPEVITDAPEG
jgi:hypothetical protein